MRNMKAMFLLGAMGGFVAPLWAAGTLSSTDNGALQELYQSFKVTGTEAPDWLVAELFPGSGDGGVAPLFSDDDDTEDGHNPANAKIIDSLPYSDHERTTSSSGASNAVPASAYANPSLCAQVGDFYTGSARDRSYRISLDAPTSLDIDLCNAGFDCVLGVFAANGSSLGACVARDDDGCGANRHSRILSCTLPTGTYFIVVDGSGSQTGVYTLDVDVAECSDPGYPDGYDVALEDEGNGMDTNGGCNDNHGDDDDDDDEDANLEVVADGSMLGGSTWADDGDRDEDWYELVLNESGTIHAAVATGCVPMEVRVLDAGCLDGTEYASAQVAAGASASAATACVPSGVYRVLVRPQGTSGYPDSGFHHYGLGITVENCVLPCEGPLELVCGDVVNAAAPTANSFTAGEESCTGGSHNGFDHEYALSIAQECDAVITMDNHGSMDAVLLLRTDCADAASCIAGADATSDGAPEQLTVRLQPGTYTVIADFHNQGGEAYTLTVDCTAVEQVAIDGEPTGFTLQQAVPNPFNPATTLAYHLNETGPVQLKVYDLLGHEVATLVDGMGEAGSHSVVFDGNCLASGVYIYTLQASGQVESRKMILAK